MSIYAKSRIIGILLPLFLITSLGAVEAMAQEQKVVDVTLEALSTPEEVGEIFTLAVNVVPNGQELSGVAAYIDFDPEHLDVMDADTEVDGVQIKAGSRLGLQLWNEVNNSTGEISYSAGNELGEPLPTDTFALATITFQLKEAISSTDITFHIESPRRTEVALAGGSVLRSTTGLTLGPGTTPRSTSPTPPTSVPAPESAPTISAVLLNGLTYDASSLRIGESSVAQRDCRVTSLDGAISLSIDEGTYLLNSEGQALNTLSASLSTSWEMPPAGKTILAAYTLGPSGATFEPAISLTMSYDDGALPEEAREDELYIAYWDGSHWLGLESAVDAKTNTVSAMVEHFTQFAIVAEVKPGLTRWTFIIVTTIAIGSVIFIRRKRRSS